MRGCACRGTAGFAHVSCLAEQAKILCDEAEEKNSDDNQWSRWHRCSLCKQGYHGVVRCALGWACWKAYLGRPAGERLADETRDLALSALGNGLSQAKQHADALSVREVELSIQRRCGAPESAILKTQVNLASTYASLGRSNEALQMKRDVYFGHLKVKGEEHPHTLTVGTNYAAQLLTEKRHTEAKSLLLKMLPVSRRVGENHDLTLRMRGCYAEALYSDPDATLSDVREAVNTLEEMYRTARRVFGDAHPFATAIGSRVRLSQQVLSGHEKAHTLGKLQGAPVKVNIVRIKPPDK